MPKKILISRDQKSLPFAGVMRARVFRERQILIGIGVGILALALLYVYFIATSVSHVVERQGLAKDSQYLSASVAGLEKDYLARVNGITESYAHSLGYVAPTSQVFIETGGTLSVRDAR